MSGDVQARARSMANTVVEVTNEFEDWLRAHPGSAAGDADAIVRDISAMRRRARTIARACGRPSAIAIYGESQVGKSYLVSTLAKGPTNSRVKVTVGTRQCDFLTEINPPGNKESTGLVTRFSRHAPAGTTAEMPVYVELLSELDIVKILADTYFGDIQHKHTQALSEDALQRALDRAKAARRQPAAHLHPDDINMLSEFIRDDIHTLDKLKVLTPDVWTKLQALLPNLAVADRIDLYALLWLEEKPLTDAAAKLIGALEQLGHADEAIVGIEAIIPRETSIIDVETLAGFAIDGGDKLQVHSPSKRVTAAIGRATLCALTAELYMQLSFPAGGAMDYCDLLDFPGARAREKNETLDAAINKPSDSKLDGMSQLFRRGKVDVLFKRYTKNQELAALLLCRRTGNQEVKDVAFTVYDWIEMTLGPSATDRSKDNTLFVLFTRFDELVVPKPGGGTPESTLANPITNAFVEFFNQNLSDNWPRNWRNGDVFKNCHWYRNPFAARSPVFDYAFNQDSGEEDLEVSVLPRYQEHIGKLRDAFLQSAHLNQYFHDPARAWDSVMTIQDGGVSYIAERLNATVNPTTKFDQLAGRIRETAAQLRVRLDALYISDDREAERQKRLRKLRDTIVAVQNNVIAYKQFGFMLDSLLIHPGDLSMAVRGALSEQAHDGETGEAVRSGYDVTRSSRNIFDDEEPEIQATFDLNDHVGSVILKQWSSHVRDVTSSPAWRRRLRLQEDAVNNLADELMRIAEHQGVQAWVAETVQSWRQRGGQGMIEGLNLLLRQVSDQLNAFIYYFGYERMPADQRPRLGDSRLPLFHRPLDPEREFEVADQQGAFNQPLYDSWGRALWLRTNEAANNDQGAEFDRQANDKLGRYLGKVNAALA